MQGDGTALSGQLSCCICLSRLLSLSYLFVTANRHTLLFTWLRLLSSVYISSLTYQ